MYEIYEVESGKQLATAHELGLAVFIQNSIRTGVVTSIRELIKT